MPLLRHWQHLFPLKQRTLIRTVHSSRSCSHNEFDAVGFIGRHLTLLPSRFKSQAGVYKSENQYWFPLFHSFTSVNNWCWFVPICICLLMSRKSTRLANLDASVMEAEMRCGSEWPIGLVDAIAQAHQTTVRCVIERRRVLRPSTRYGSNNPEFNPNFANWTLQTSCL